MAYLTSPPGAISLRPSSARIIAAPEFPSWKHSKLAIKLPLLKKKKMRCMSSLQETRVSVKLLGKEKIQDKMSRFENLTSTSLFIWGLGFLDPLTMSVRCYLSEGA